MRKSFLLAALLAGAAFTAQAYEAPTVQTGRFVEGTLTNKSIPKTNGGRFTDYSIALREGHFAIITVESDDFDPEVTLIDAGGNQIGYNDDDEDSLNSLLVARVKSTGDHIIRVGSVGSDLGKFKLRVDTLARD